VCVLSIQAQGVAEAEGRRGCPIRPKNPSGGTAGGSAAGRGSNAVGLGDCVPITGRSALNYIVLHSLSRSNHRCLC